MASKRRAKPMSAGRIADIICLFLWYLVETGSLIPVGSASPSQTSQIVAITVQTLNGSLFIHLMRILMVVLLIANVVLFATDIYRRIRS